MQTYRDLFRAREFSSLFVALSVRNAAETMSGLALATLVYGRTGSALLAALAMFGSSLAQVVGAMTLLSIADRVAPRAALSVIGLTLAIVTAGMAVQGSPVWLLLTIELAGGLVTAASGGVVWGLVNEIVPNGAWVLGRSVFNASVGIMQIAGFATGGALLHFTSARGALWVACGLYVASVVLVRSGLAARPPRASGRSSVRETWAGNVRLWSSPARRFVYLALWVPNGLIVGCEAIFVAYAPNSAAALFVAAGVGMLAGDITVGRLLGRGLRARLITPLRVLLAAPYLLLIASPAPALAMVPVAVASLGYSAGLLLQERLIALTPDADPRPGARPAQRRDARTPGVRRDARGLPRRDRLTGNGHGDSGHRLTRDHGRADGRPAPLDGHVRSRALLGLPHLTTRSGLPAPRAAGRGLADRAPTRWPPAPAKASSAWIVGSTKRSRPQGPRHHLVIN